jgi:hypothetical protein
MTRASSLSLKKRDGIDQRECLLGVVAIGPRELDCQRNALTIADQMTLAAQLRPISGIRACMRPPKTARMELPSMIARDQSICW